MTKPKILFLVTSFIRFKGDDSAWFDYLRLCTKEGPEYDVIAPHDKEKSKGFEEIENVRIHRFQYFFPKSAQALAYYGGVFHNLSRSLSGKIQFPFFMVSFFIKALKNIKGKDMMHAIFLPSTLTAAILKKLTGKPFVIWVQRMVFGTGPTKWLNLFVLRNCDHVFFNSSYTQKETLKKITPKSHSILHMGVDQDIFKPMSKIGSRKKLKLPQKQKIVFAIGRFVEKKGFEYLIEAMSLIKTKDVQLLIAGFGPLEQKFKALVKENRLGQTVKFVGLVPNKSVPLWLNACDVFVVPSIVDSGGETETLGIVAVEGIACGKPVIASSVGGLVDVIKKDISGFPVKQKNPEEIAEKIDLLFGKKGLIEKMGKKARKYAQENHSEKQAVDKTMKVYEKILGTKF